MPILHGDTSKIRKILREEIQASWCRHSKVFYIIDKEKWKVAQNFIYEFEKNVDNKINLNKEKTKNEETKFFNALIAIEKIPTLSEALSAFYLVKNACYKYQLASKNEAYKEFYLNYPEFCELIGMGRNMRRSGMKEILIDHIAKKLNLAGKILNWKKIV